MIRLVSVIGHGTNLISHFIQHYSNYVDKICFVVYNTDERPRFHEEVQENIQDYDNVSIVKIEYNRIFDWEKVTMLYNSITNENPEDWWVIADIDEFHLYPENSLNLLISDCEKNGWDLVRGGFIDRIGEEGNLVEIDNNKSIWEQFPSAGFFRYPMSNACPNKICVKKGYVELTSGQHYAKINDMTTWRFQGWNHPLIAPYQTHSVQVHHFKWDSTSSKRVRDVANVNQEYAYSDEYRKMYKELVKLRFVVDVTDNNFMFEKCTKPDFNQYTKWNKLINKITSV